MRNGLVKFIVVWNEIIKSFREEDIISNRLIILSFLINYLLFKYSCSKTSFHIKKQMLSHVNREVELMKMPLSSELFSGLVRWPIFLLANQVAFGFHYLFFIKRSSLKTHYSSFYS